MKKIIYTLLIAAAMFFCNQQQATAQTSVIIYYAGDSMGITYCQVPSTINFWMYGQATGYLPNDSLTIQVLFGDGTDTTFMYAIQNPTFYPSFYHTYTLPGIYSVQFIATGPDGAADTVTNTNATMVAAQCGNISGKVYYDSNNDCIINAGDHDMPWQAVRLLYNGTQVGITYTDLLGNYYLSAASGFTYTLEIDQQNPNLVTTCPVSGSYTISTLPANTKNFGVTCSLAGFDLTGSLSCWGVRPGLTANLYLDYWNDACSPVSGTVTVTLPPGVTYVSAIPAPTNVSGNVITYNVSPYDYYWQYPWNAYNYITVMGDTSLNIGDTVCFMMTLDPQSGDLNPYNNVIETCVPVRNSCDPNEKFETHAGYDTGYILPATQLDYTIFFQNVGNDVAYNINVVDTLHSNLDMNTLKITSASHNMTIRTLGTNIFKFEFPNINLAASSVNEPESHGFITYSVSPLAGLADGTIMDNRAHIYFDFNGAIITNTVTDIIDMSLDINEQAATLVMSVYPNPAAGFVQIKLDNSQPVTVRIFDPSGKLVLEKLMKTNGTISLKDLDNGTYLIKATSEKKEFISKLVIVK